MRNLIDLDNEGSLPEAVSGRARRCKSIHSSTRVDAHERERRIEFSLAFARFPFCGALPAHQVKPSPAVEALAMNSLGTKSADSILRGPVSSEQSLSRLGLESLLAIRYRATVRTNG